MTQHFRPRAFLPLLGLALALPLGAAQAQALWADDATARTAAASAEYSHWLHAYRPVTLDVAAMQATLANATTTRAITLALPLPNGTTGRFRIVESPVMEAPLAARYPQIRTYAGVGLDDATASVRLDLTPLGFHAQILSRRAGTVYIDPLSQTDTQHYLVFGKADMNYAARPQSSACGFRSEQADAATTTAQRAAPGTGTGTAARVNVSAGTQLRNYRLALATSGEYTRVRGGTTGGTAAIVTRTLAAVTTSVNRVTGVYEKELAVHLNLIANEDTLIFTNAATDPYTNQSDGGTLNTNQTVVDSRIGSANYDIGHIFNTADGGIAGYAVVCGSRKAQGSTGLPNPVGDAFDIDYVAHEMGHQFSGSHPFNGSTGSCGGGNREPSAAWEPGSGSTIMAYAGICAPQDLQAHSDAYFHGGNLTTEMLPFIANQAVCSVNQATGNTPPTVTMPLNGLVIPAGTPFRLTATGADADGDTLTYCWEEMDLGPAGAPIRSTTTQTPNQTPPLFRSYAPTLDSTRYFPRLQDLVRPSPTAWPVGNALPTVNRAMKFRCTVRDEHVSPTLGMVVGGVTISNQLSFNVTSSAGPFTVVTPTRTVAPGDTLTVRWNVANTDQAPVNSQAVSVRLSVDNGVTYPYYLDEYIANDGSAVVTIPASLAATTNARLMVESADNFFFNITSRFSLGQVSGLADTRLNALLTVVPNPSEGAFALELPAQVASKATLVVTDALGRTVQATALRADQTGLLRHTVDLRTQASGVYAVRLTLADGRIATQRLVKL